MRKVYCFLSFVFAFGGAFAQSEDSIFIRRISDEILLRGKAYDDLRVLTKQVGGRLAGSPQMVKAEAWGLATFQTLHPDRSWMQECMVPHWVRGGNDFAAASSPPSVVAHKLDVLALGNSKGTGAKGLLAPVMEVKSFEELEQR